MKLYTSADSFSSGSAYSDDDDVAYFQVSSQPLSSSTPQPTEEVTPNHTALVFLSTLVFLTFLALVLKYYTGPVRLRCKKNPSKSKSSDKAIPLKPIKTETEALLDNTDFDV